MQRIDAVQDNEQHRRDQSDDRTSVFRCEGLTKTFYSTEPPTEVIKGVDLTVPAGEFLTVMGSSGSGKSTLLYSMSGMDRPTGGRVELEGRDLMSLNDQDMSRLRLSRMGFVFQQAYFLRNLSVRDNILLPAVKSGKYSGDKADARVDELLTRFGIDHVGNHGITQVSGGQLQRASICRALVNSPSILFADEPTGALNSSMTTEVLDALSGAHREGTTLVMVTHDPVCAARADRLVYLRDGRVVDEYRSGRRNGLSGQDERLDGVMSWLRKNDF